MELKTPKVLDPISINGIEVKNRIVFTAHGTRLSGDDQIAYLEARARGGCGLIIMESTSVHETSGGWNPSYLHSNTDDGVIAGYRRIADRIHPHGTVLFQQLVHGGQYSFQPGRRPPVGPSALAGGENLGVAIPLLDEQIEEIIEGFGAAARRCRDGGVDGVEIHGAHGYLVAQFLATGANHRTDRWGGSVENRQRFALEVMRSVRRQAGSDFTLGIRLSASEALGGVSQEDIEQLIVRLEAEGLVDYVNASHGDHYNVSRVVATMDEPTGYQLPTTSKFLAKATVPRIAIGRFRTLDEAQQVLNDGFADMVGMVRAQIADPDLVRKTVAGHPEQVRPCIACNQGCINGLYRDLKVGCAVNPAAAAELALGDHRLVPAEKPRKVLVIGGGPAGMEAARIAALRGHQVVLMEAGAKLGGAVNAAKRAPLTHTVGDITEWQERQVFELGVDVRFGTYAEAGDALAEGADTIIVATGSYPRMDGIQSAYPESPAVGSHLPHVLSSVDLLTQGRNDFGTHALVLDDTGHYEAIAAAEMLLNLDIAVTWVTRFPSFAPLVENTWRGPAALRRFYRKDFKLLVGHHLVEIAPGEASVMPLHVPERQARVRADTVVLVTPNAPLRDLFEELYGQHPDVRLVGDALAPRDIQFAIRDGYRAALDERL